MYVTWTTDTWDRFRGEQLRMAGRAVPVEEQCIYRKGREGMWRDRGKMNNAGARKNRSQGKETAGSTVYFHTARSVTWIGQKMHAGEVKFPRCIRIYITVTISVTVLSLIHSSNGKKKSIFGDLYPLGKASRLSGNTALTVQTHD